MVMAGLVPATCPTTGAAWLAGTRLVPERLSRGPAMTDRFIRSTDAIVSSRALNQRLYARRRSATLQSWVNSPDLPPALCVTRSASTRIERSTALHMS